MAEMSLYAFPLAMVNSILPKAFDFLKENSQSVIVVVSPLIALMKDQVRALAKCNIR